MPYFALKTALETPQNDCSLGASTKSYARVAPGPFWVQSNNYARVVPYTPWLTACQKGFGTTKLADVQGGPLSP